MADEEIPGSESEATREGRPAAAGPTDPELHADHDPYAAFRFGAYRYFAGGNLILVTGRAMLSVAVGWEIY